MQCMLVFHKLPAHLFQLQQLPATLVVLLVPLFQSQQLLVTPVELLALQGLYLLVAYSQASLL